MEKGRPQSKETEGKKKGLGKMSKSKSVPEWLKNLDSVFGEQGLLFGDVKTPFENLFIKDAKPLDLFLLKSVLESRHESIGSKKSAKRKYDIAKSCKPFDPLKEKLPLNPLVVAKNGRIVKVERSNLTSQLSYYLLLKKDEVFDMEQLEENSIEFQVFGDIVDLKLQGTKGYTSYIGSSDFCVRSYKDLIKSGEIDIFAKNVMKYVSTG